MDGMMTGGLPLTDGMTLGWALGVTLKTIALLTATGLLTLALLRSSAALRHLVWSLAIGGVLVLPFIPMASPWSWEVLPDLGMTSETVAAAERASEEHVPGNPVEGSALESFGSDLQPLRSTSRIPSVSAHQSPEATANETPRADERERTAPTVASDEAVAAVEAALSGGGVGRAGSEPGPGGSWPLMGIAFGIWASVALLLILHQLIGRLALLRITSNAEPVDHADPVGGVEQVDSAEVRWEFAWSVGVAGVSRSVRVLRSDRVRVPMTWGVRRPVVLLPSESRSWSPERLRLVLHHELAHVRRMDALTDALSRMACALHWFNPMVWWAAARLRAESEKASDDLVLRSGARASEYAGHLLELVTNLGSRRAPAGAIPLAQQSEFEGRLLAILDPSRERRGVRRVSAGVLGATLVACVVAIGSAAPASATPAQEGAGDAGEMSAHEQTDPAANEARRAEAVLEEEDVTGEEDVVGEDALAPSQRVADESTITRDGVADRVAEDEGIADEGEPRSPASDVDAAQALDTTSVRALTQALRNDSSAEVRRTSAWALGQIEDPAATPALVEALRSDESAAVRRMAVWALGQIEDPSAAGALGEALADEDTEVRETALWALGQIESAEAVGPLTRALSDTEPGVRKTAAWALGQIESPEAVPALSAALEDQNAEVRAQAVWALGQIESVESVEPLGRALRDEDVEVRRQAAWALGQVESAGAVDALSNAVSNDTDANVRRQAAWALGQIESEAAVPALVEALSDADAEVARMAAWSLGQIEPSSAPPELIEAARSGTGELRATAIWALVEIEDPAAVPALVEALQDEDSEVRTRALRGLAEIGSVSAVEAIAELLQDPDPEVREAAARALAGRGRWNSPRPNPNPNPDPDPRPRVNGSSDGSGSGSSSDPGSRG